MLKPGKGSEMAILLIDDFMGGPVYHHAHGAAAVAACMGTEIARMPGSRISA